VSPSHPRRIGGRQLFWSCRGSGPPRAVWHCFSILRLTSRGFSAQRSPRIHQVRQKLLPRLLVSEDLTELCAHVLPEVWGLVRGRWPAGLRLRHPGQALAPEGVLGQAVLEELEQREADHRHDPDGQVNGFRLGLGDMPPAGRNVQPIPHLSSSAGVFVVSR
jgi:hypothetical protein